GGLDPDVPDRRRAVPDPGRHPAPAGSLGRARRPGPAPDKPPGGRGPATAGARGDRGGAVMIEVRNLKKSFAGHTVIHGVSFDVAGNEVVGLIGPNGAGKTTIIQLMSGAYRADSGSVTLDGKDI